MPLPPGSEASRVLRPRVTQLARTVLVLATLTAPSVWSWRSLVIAGIANHAPVYRYLGGLGAGGDIGQSILFVKWLPFALAHGMNPLFSKMMFAPQGINLLSNTSYLFPAFVLAPITILFGPVAAFDLGVILAPVLSAYALYWVLRRYDTAVPAALIASLFYGYSPYLMKEAPLGHFQAAWMFFPPLALYLLHHIFALQRLSPWKSGLALGLLTVAQFFTSLEVLLETAILGLVLVVITVAAHPRSVAGKLRHAATGSGIAAGVAGALLAYPLWFALAGPEHVSTFNRSISTIADAVTSAAWPSVQTVPGVRYPFTTRIDAGFAGPVACMLLVASCLLWKRYRLVPIAVAGAVVSYVLSWGPYVRISSTGSTHVRGPDYWLLQVHLLRDLQEYRFAAFTDLFLAVAIAACLDWASRTVQKRQPELGPIPRAVLALGAAAAVLTLPWFGIEWSQPNQRVTAPTVLTSGPMAHLPIGTVALVSPSPYVTQGAPLVWQAVSGLRYDDVNGYGWRQATGGGLGTTLGASSSVSRLLGPVMFGGMPAPPSRVSSQQMADLRTTLLEWRVADIVLVGGYPDATGADPRIITALVGRRPARIGDSLLWTGVTSRLAARHTPYTTFVSRPRT